MDIIQKKWAYYNFVKWSSKKEKGTMRVQKTIIHGMAQVPNMEQLARFKRLSAGFSCDVIGKH